MSDETGPRRRKPPRRITAAYLARVTSHYLERYSTTRAHLRRLLGQRVQRSAAHHGEDPEDGMALVDAELERLESLGLINDAAFARDRAKALHRRGKSLRAIAAALRTKGLSSERIDEALEALASGVEGSVELIAAATFARKRRLGPWRSGAPDPDRTRKELAKLARAGFSYALARRVVDAEDPSDLA